MLLRTINLSPLLTQYRLANMNEQFMRFQRIVEDVQCCLSWQQFFPEQARNALLLVMQGVRHRSDRGKVREARMCEGELN